MKSSRNLYLIALGSNLGDRATTIDRAAQLVAERIGPVRSRASLYETEPVGAADLPFINSALVTTSELEPEDVLRELLAIEQELGRVRRERWGNRTIDLDVLLWLRRVDACGGATYTAERHESATLAIPHPRLLDRDFALVPACEVAADWRHPVTGMTLRDERTARGYFLAPLAYARS